MPTTFTMPVETRRKRRGHAFLPPKAVMRRVPTLDEYDLTPEANQKFWIKFFSPSMTWFVVSVEEDGTAFGYVVNHADPWASEWGTFSLPELERLYIPPFVIIERDKFFEPTLITEVMARLDAGRHV